MKQNMTDNDILKQNSDIIAQFVKVMGVSSNDDLLKFPKRIAIEVTSSCNARCVMCPIEEWERGHRIMPDSIFNKIVEDILPFADWVSEVSLHLEGEPLIDKKLEEKVITMKKLGIKSIMITSNASLMTPGRAESLINAGIDRIDFSIDGSTKETFEAIRKRLIFEECVENVESFIAARNRLKKPVKISVRMTVSETNRNEYEDFKSYWKSRLGENDRVYGKLIHTWGSWVEEFAPGHDVDKAALNKRACVSPWVNMNIFTDGRVPLCCCDFNAEVMMGDVTKNTIQEIWQNSISQNVRDQMISLGRNWHEKCIDCLAWDQSLKLS